MTSSAILKIMANSREMTQTSETKLSSETSVRPTQGSVVDSKVITVTGEPEYTIIRPFDKVSLPLPMQYLGGGDIQQETKTEEDPTLGGNSRVIALVNPRADRLLLSHIRSALRGMKKPAKFWLSYYAVKTGAVNTAFSWQYGLQPSADSSFAAYQAIFDEMKVLQARLHWGVWFDVLPSAFAAQPPNSIVAYEPESAVTLASVNNGLEYDKYQLLSVGANSNGTYAVAPQAVSTNPLAAGFNVFEAAVPSDGTQSSIVTTTDSAGQWRPTADASNYNWGSFTGYTAQGGATSVLQTQAFVRMLVEFRVRI